MGRQVDNGRSFEFAIVDQLEKWVGKRTRVEVMRDATYAKCKSCHAGIGIDERERFDRAAFLPIDTLTRLEPGILNAKGDDDVLHIRLCQDKEGQGGDVRDVVLFRKNKRGEISWEIGISAKNNNDAAKHSRLSMDLRFGEKWLEMDTSDDYIKLITPVFNWITSQKEAGVRTWRQIESLKAEHVYEPLLMEFMRELKRLFELDQLRTAEKLILYLVGRMPFYKIIKDDSHNTTVMKVFNFVKGLGKSYNGVRPQCRPQSIPMPTRCVEIAFADKPTHDTVSLIMDCGWQVNFRIHSADGPLRGSLKFDTTLVGNPPILFTQHLF